MELATVLSNTAIAVAIRCRWFSTPQSDIAFTAHYGIDRTDQQRRLPEEPAGRA